MLEPLVYYTYANMSRMYDIAHITSQQMLVYCSLFPDTRPHYHPISFTVFQTFDVSLAIHAWVTSATHPGTWMWRKDVMTKRVCVFDCHRVENHSRCVCDEQSASGSLGHFLVWIGLNTLVESWRIHDHIPFSRGIWNRVGAQQTNW